MHKIHYIGQGLPEFTPVEIAVLEAGSQCYRQPTSVLLSINPEHCYNILQGQETIEIRKTKPSISPPFKCYIYCTKPRNHFRAAGGYLSTDELYRLPNGEIKYGCSVELAAYDNYTKENFLNGKVIGEFVCDVIFPVSITYSDTENRMALREFPFTGLTDKQIIDYLGNGRQGYGWHISNLKLYDDPKELIKFCYPCKTNKNIADEDCKGCKYGFKGITQGKISCDRTLTRPPISWCYAEYGDI